MSEEKQQDMGASADADRATAAAQSNPQAVSSKAGIPSAALDRFRDRFQIEAGVNFYLMPNDTVDSKWSRHLFDPWFKLVKVGDELHNPRTELPKFGQGFVDHEITKADPPGSAPAIHRWWSRCFWFATGVRLLGLEVGVGVFYRQRFTFPAQGIVTAAADETRSGSVERSEIEPGPVRDAPEPRQPPPQDTPNPTPEDTR